MRQKAIAALKAINIQKFNEITKNLPAYERAYIASEVNAKRITHGRSRRPLRKMYEDMLKQWSD